MDKRQFEALLEQTLHEEIPNVELWNQIERKLPASSSKTVKQGFRLGKVALIAALLTMTSAAAYAFYQVVILPSDPGVEEVTAADLLTPIDESQRLLGQFEENNLTVTLDYAYADANRITVAYTVTGESTDGEMRAFSNPSLEMAEGESIQRFMLLANEETEAENESGFGHRLTANFAAGDLPVDTESLDLALLVEIAVTQPEIDPMGMIMAGAARFEFSVPFIAGEIVEIGQTAEAADVTVELTRLVITPSMTRAELCYTLPLTEDQSQWPWSPVGTLTVNEQLTVENAVLENFSVGEDSDCYGVVIPYPLQEAAGTWTLEIAEFRSLNGDEAPLAGPWRFTFEVAQRQA